MDTLVDLGLQAPVAHIGLFILTDAFSRSPVPHLPSFQP